MAGRSTSEQLFRVAYDPVCDCFVLQDAECGGEQRSRTMMMTQADAGGVPWDQWVRAPRSASKDRAHQQQYQKDPRPRFVSKPAELLTTWTTNNRGEGGALSDAMAELTLDLQAVAAPPTEGPILKPTTPFAALPPLDLSTLAVPPTEGPILKPPTPAVRKARVRDYNAHFARVNAQLLPNDVALLQQDHPMNNRVPIEPTWNGEPVRVKVACVRHFHTRIESDDTHKEAERATSASNQRIDDFALVARIRSSGDGFRDADVNRGCSFPPLTSSSSSEEDEAGRSSSSSLSSLSDASSLCEFERGDCVLFRAKRRRFRGAIVRRVRGSSFYDVRAANGTLFRAVAATHIRLLPLDDRSVCEPPRLPLSFQRGDRVLWLPTTTQSYKARVVRLRSLDRYDIELRSGRVHRKVSSEELQPAV